MLKRPKILQNLDKFYGLADSAVLSLFRFVCGLIIARFGGTELFASYILLITTNVIFQILPSTSFLMPLLNRGTGAAPRLYGELCIWAQRGVERVALVFFLLGSLLLLAIPQIPISLLTGFGFLLACCAQLWQQSLRTRLQMEFKQSRALFADLASCGLHLGLAGLLWSGGSSLLAAFWWGAWAGALGGGLLMRGHLRSLERGLDEASSELIQTARQQGRAMLRGSIANSACSRIQPYLLGAIASAEALAYYGVLWTLIGPVRLLSMALTNLLRPRLALFNNQQQPKEFNRIYRLALLLLASSGLGASLLALLYGSNIVAGLFGTELAPAGQWLSLALLYAGLDATTTCQMIATQIRQVNGAALTARLRIHAALISLSLVVPATLWFGLSGTIGSLIIAELYYALACYWQTRKHQQNEYSNKLSQSMV